MLDYLIIFYVIGIVGIAIFFVVLIWRNIKNRKLIDKKLILFLIASLICLDIGLRIRIAAMSNGKIYEHSIKPEKNAVPIYVMSNSSTIKTKEEIRKNSNDVIFVKGDNSLGLGFIINSSGYVITNYHLIDKSVKFTGVFQNDNRSASEKIPMDLIAFDPDLDIALLKLRDERSFNYLYFGDSDKATNNENIITIGGTKETIKSISECIITDLESISNLKYIKTSAQVSTESSGGVLINREGEIIGLITYCEHNGENLALSSRKIMKFMDKYSTIESIKNYSQSRGANSVSKSESCNNVISSYDGYNFILPYSSEKKLEYDEIKNFDIYLLGMARSEIYARHGYIFTVPQYANYFDTKSWYKRNANFSESELNDIEKFNVLFIYKREQQLKGE